jgi:hypothetical protein
MAEDHVVVFGLDIHLFSLVIRTLTSVPHPVAMLGPGHCRVHQLQHQSLATNPTQREELSLPLKLAVSHDDSFRNPGPVSLASACWRRQCLGDTYLLTRSTWCLILSRLALIDFRALIPSSQRRKLGLCSGQVFSLPFPPFVQSDT